MLSLIIVALVIVSLHNNGAVTKTVLIYYILKNFNTATIKTQHSTYTQIIKTTQHNRKMSVSQ